MMDVPKRPDPNCIPVKSMSLALLFAIKGGGTRALLPLADPRLHGIVSPGAGAHALGRVSSRPTTAWTRSLSGRAHRTRASQTAMGSS